MKVRKAMRTFKELYYEYSSSIAVQEQIIENSKMYLAIARKNANYKEVKRLNGILCVLNEEKSELEERAFEIQCYIHEEVTV